MKKTALLALSLLAASHLNAALPTLSLSPRVKGAAKLAGSAGLSLYSLMTLKSSFANFRASRAVNPTGWVTWRGPKHWLPVPSFLVSQPSKKDQQALSKYQFGTTGFCAMLAHKLYHSGMNEFSSEA